MTMYSTCTQHPSTEATGRCKQCGKPFCNACRVQGPTGYFCSEYCRSSHEAFVHKAKQLDDMKRGFDLRMITRNWWRALLVILILLIIAHYYGYEIPVLSGMLEGIVPQGE